MRISSLYNSSAMLYQMGNNSQNISKLMQQLATQKRVNVPSDDPIAATRLVQLNREQSAIEQYQSNITRLSGSLAAQESYLTSMNNQMLALNDKLLSAANGTHSQEDMSGYGAEIDSMVDSIVASLNAKNESGGYLFAGTNTGTMPVRWDEEQQKYFYDGNDGTRETTVANGVNIQENTHVAQAFGLTADGELSVLSDLKALAGKMQDPSIPFSDYQDEINQMLDKLSGARDNVAAIFTDVGGRQNRLTQLADAHTGVSMANEQVIRDLADTDIATASINLTLYMNSVQITNQAYSMVSKLSLFSVM